MDDILGKIQTVAPHLFNLLDNLIQPDLALQRHRPVRQRQPFLVEIFATICYGQQKVLLTVSILNSVCIYMPMGLRSRSSKSSQA